MKRFFSIATLVGGLLFAGPAVEIASACPLCKEANETNPALPRAYMYSILFMLGMPATVLAGFGFGFYRLSRKAAQAAAEAAEQASNGIETTETQYVSEPLAAHPAPTNANP